MSENVFKAENVGKKYIIRHQAQAGGSLRERITESVLSLGRRLKPGVKDHGNSDATREEFWALRNVSLEIKRGEVVGLIGRNGAGKSTLLKIISRITEPTEGRISLKGRVSSLLEVGTGFHPELTGRENIYLNGAILGMRKTEIQRKFDEIVAFAEIDRFLDTPVKRYSSGMYVRLAFAVAAHLEPEILIIDEVLAVGDAAFQRKCLGRMDNAAREGRTVILVSHNMLSVEGLCNRAVWMHEGTIVAEGEPHEVIANYLRIGCSALTEQAWENRSTAPGTDEVRLHSARVRPTEGSPTDPLRVSRALVIEFEFWTLRPSVVLTAGIKLFNEQGILIFESQPQQDTPWSGKPLPKGLLRYACHVPADLLNNGVHRVTLWMVKNDEIVHKEDDILVFDVADSMEKRGDTYRSWEGAVRPMLTWETHLVHADDVTHRLVRA